MYTVNVKRLLWKYFCCICGHCENIVCKMHYTCYSHDIGLPNPKRLLSSTDRPSRKRTSRCKRRRSRNHRRKGTVDCVIFRLTYATQWVFVASATQLRLLLQSTRLHVLEAGSSAKFITHKNICVYDNCCCACMLHFNWCLNSYQQNFHGWLPISETL